MVDLATLTGACMVALGTRIAGLLQQRRALVAQAPAACRAGRRTRSGGSRSTTTYSKLLETDVADLKNVGGKWGGAITAAKFLEQFVGDDPWAHLDIAGPLGRLRRELALQGRHRLRHSPARRSRHQLYRSDGRCGEIVRGSTSGSYAASSRRAGLGGGGGGDADGDELRLE